MSSDLIQAWESLKTSGYLGYVSILICALVGHSWINKKTAQKIDSNNGTAARSTNADGSDDDDDETEPPRNFTATQLLHYDGTQCPKFLEPKPVYLSIAGKVFDVSSGREFYGPGASYEIFAGHECGIALAKMSFDTSHLDDIAGCQMTSDGGKLNYAEKDELDNWLMKFEHYKCYPVVGALIADEDMPDPGRIVTKEELRKNDGKGELPKGYATTPLYVGAKGRVFDVSFGGVTFYGEGCPYHLFVGVDASRALALMSLDKADASNPDVSDLTAKQINTLNEWVTTFEEKKMYPIVGRLEE